MPDKMVKPYLKMQFLIWLMYVRRYLERNNLTNDDVAWLVAHQANKRIVEATARRMKLDASKVMLNIQNYGNTTSATIPLLFADYEKQLKKGG